jgi:hypothetical protein
MKNPKLGRLVLIAVLFALWIGYLAYLALPTTTSREVLSRAQFLVSNYDVIAQVNAEPNGAPDTKVVVEQVHWPKEAEKISGQTVTVANLTVHATGWHGPGRYILPLMKEDSTYRVAPIPRSPGFEGSPHARIYSATEQNLRQLDSIPKPGTPQ